MKTAGTLKLEKWMVVAIVDEDGHITVETYRNNEPKENVFQVDEDLGENMIRYSSTGIEEIYHAKEKYGV